MCAEKEPITLPLVVLHGISVLPGMLIHFDISRKITVKAVEEAMQSDQMVFVTMHKEEESERLEQDDLYAVGTVSKVKQMLKLPGDVVRVMVEGQERAELISLNSRSSFLEAEVRVSKNDATFTLSKKEHEAMLRGMKDILEVYFSEFDKIGKGVRKQLMDSDKLDELLNQILVNIPIALQDKQHILEAADITEKYERTAVILSDEIEIYRIRKEFQAKVREEVDKNQKDYLLREQMKVIREELGETDTESDADHFMEEIEQLEASDEVKEKIKKEVKRFQNISSSSSESAVSRGYIETLLELPWDKKGVDTKDLKNAEKILNEDHYGLAKVKERILEFLAVRILTEKGDSPVICLVGPPGTGKTSIAKSVARALDKKYVRICLGGVRDEAEIRGHRRTYVGAMPGRIINGLVQAEVKNPLMLLDEIDKVSSDYKGDTSSALLEVLDSEQNNKFVDHYVEIPIDLSEVLFIATANDAGNIPKPLADRMEIIEVNSYTENEKFHIAREHLIRKQIRKNGLKEKQLLIQNKALENIITGYTKEAGVRNLERKIGAVCRKAAREILEQDKKQVRVTDKNLEKYLGKIKYTREEAGKQPEIGVVRGLAWTSVGGDTLQIEVSIVPGKGRIELTGQMGDVMKESAKIGISYLRSISPEFGIKKKFYEEHDIHIHIPEGAVPKDGPSAGITMATAVLSAVSGLKVREDLAMTGEITLRGHVLPIGGLKEKILAAKAAKIGTVLVPKKNRKDIEEMEQEITDGIEIRYVEKMEEVLAEALIEE